MRPRCPTARPARSKCARLPSGRLLFGRRPRRQRAEPVPTGELMKRFLCETSTESASQPSRRRRSADRRHSRPSRPARDCVSVPRRRVVVMIASGEGGHDRTPEPGPRRAATAYLGLRQPAGPQAARERTRPKRRPADGRAGRRRDRRAAGSRRGKSQRVGVDGRLQVDGREAGIGANRRASRDVHDRISRITMTAQAVRIRIPALACITRVDARTTKLEAHPQTTGECPTMGLDPRPPRRPHGDGWRSTTAIFNPA